MIGILSALARLAGLLAVRAGLAVALVVSRWRLHHAERRAADCGCRPSCPCQVDL